MRPRPLFGLKKQNKTKKNKAKPGEQCPTLHTRESRVSRLGEGRPLATKTQLRGLLLGPQTQLHNTNSDKATVSFE